MNKIVWRKAHGIFRTVIGARPATQLCDMSIEDKNEGNSMVILAKMLFAGAPNVSRDVNRAIGL